MKIEETVKSEGWNISDNKRGKITEDKDELNEKLYVSYTNNGQQLKKKLF